MPALSALMLSAGAAALAALAGWGALRGNRHWSSLSFWIVPAAAVWPSVALMIVSIPGLETVLDSALSRFLLQFGPLLVLSALLVVRGLRRGRFRPGAAAAIIAVLSACVTIAAVFTGQGAAHGLIAVIVLIGCAFARGGEGDRQSVFSGVVLSAVALCMLLAVYWIILPQAAIRTDCGENQAKCDLLGGFISVGIEGGSNAFGITLAMLAAFAVYQLRWSGAVMLSIAVVGSTLASGARLATLCAAVCCVAGLMAKTPWGRVTTWAALGGAAIASSVFAIVPFPPLAFTERATLWGRAQQMILEAPWFGHGLSHWVRDAATQPPPPRSYSPHNIWLDQGVAAGLLGVGVIVAALVVGLILLPSAARVPVALLLLGVIVAGCWESTLMPFRLNPIPAGMVALLTCFSAAQVWRGVPHDQAPPASRTVR